MFERTRLPILVALRNRLPSAVGDIPAMCDIADPENENGGKPRGLRDTAFLKSVHFVRTAWENIFIAGLEKRMCRMFPNHAAVFASSAVSMF